MDVKNDYPLDTREGSQFLEPKVETMNENQSEALEPEREFQTEEKLEEVEAQAQIQTEEASKELNPEPSEEKPVLVEAQAQIQTEEASKELNPEPSEEKPELVEVQAPIQTGEASKELNPEPKEEHSETSDDLSESELEELSQLTRQELVEKLETLCLQAGALLTAKKHIVHLRVLYKEKTQAWKTELQNQEDISPEEKQDLDFNDHIEKRFSELSQAIKQAHFQQKQEQEKQKLINLEKKQGVLNSLKELLDSEESLKVIYDKFNELKETWASIGATDRGVANQLWQNYHFLVEKFFDKVKMVNELRDLDHKKNLEAKLDLCEKAESLLLLEDINKAFRNLQQLHDKWKEIGALSHDKKDEIWDRFKRATEIINQNRAAYYEIQSQKMEQSLLAKKAICEQVKEELSHLPNTIKDWNLLSDKLDKTLVLWKTLGRATKEENDSIWALYRGYMDKIYGAKKEFFSQIRDEQNQNYNKKIELCICAERIASDRKDWKLATADLLTLQEQWKKIGHTNQKHSDQVWKRFRAAADAFFEAKAAAFSHLREEETSNLQEKEDLIKQLEQMDLSIKEEAMAKIRDIQRLWTLKGHVPLKEKEKIYQQYKNTLDKIYEKLGMDKQEFERKGLLAKIEKLEKTGDASNFSSQEKLQLQARINQMREDILLWENNIGFLGRSKNANILKEEFELKIQKSKQDLALLEAKMKLIRA